MSRTLAWRTTLLVVVAIVTATACRDVPSETTRVETSPAYTLDPAHAQTESELRASSLLFLPLIGADGTGVAADWSLGPENRSLIVVLGEVAFNDGTRITAELVRESLLRFLAPETASPQTHLLTEFVDGALEFSLGLADDGRVAIEVVDRRTLRFDFLVAMPRPEEIFSHQSLAPIPLYYLADVRSRGNDEGGPWWAAADVPTSGPYEPAGQEWLRTYSQGILSLDLVQNEYFGLSSGQGRPSRARREMRVEFMSRAAALEAAARQEVDEVLGLPGPGIAEDLEVQRRCLPVMEMLLFSVREGITAAPSVRRALASAAVRALDPVLRRQPTGGRPNLLPWPAPAAPCGELAVADAFPAPTAAADWEGTLRVVFPDYGEAAAFPGDAALIDALRELGDVEAVYLPFAEYARALRTGDFDVARVRWHGGADPFYAAFTSFSGRNDAEFHNEEYDRLYRQAASSETESWPEFMERADELLIQEQVAVLPLARPLVYDYRATAR